MTTPAPVMSRLANQKFWAMINNCHQQGRGSPHMLERTLIGIDPGETTGLSWRDPREDGFRVHMTQINTQDRSIGIKSLFERIDQIPLILPLFICEDYRVYAAKTEQHAWAGLHTAKLIGRIEQVADQKGIPCVYPMAAEAKSWADDDKLKLWDIYEPGMKHGRDAERHIVTRAFFGKDPI